MTKNGFRICWKHKDFDKTSRGPILRHSDKGRIKNGLLYSRKEALQICVRFNLKGKRTQTLNGTGRKVFRSYGVHWVEDIAKERVTL